MFDVGFTELLLLAVIGLLVLGPERLPKVARTLGGLTRKARSSWLNLKRSIDAEINAEELKKPMQKMRDEVRSAVDGVDQQLKKTTGEVRFAVDGADRQLKKTGDEVNDSLTGKTSAPKPTDHDNN